MSDWEKFSKRCLDRMYEREQKKELSSVSYSGAKKFTTIYILCGAAIVLSITLPILDYSNRIQHFWEVFDYHFGWIVGGILVIAAGIAIILIGTQLKPATRSKIFFYFFAAIFSIGLIVPSVFSALFGRTKEILEIVYIAIIIICPITFYSLTVLLTKFDEHRMKVVLIILATAILFLMFIPVDNHSLNLEIFEHEENLIYAIPILMVLWSIFLSYFIFFASNSKSLAKTSAYSLMGALFSVPILILFDMRYFDWEEATIIIKVSCALYGLFFLICYSFVEFISVKMTITVAPFASPVQDLPLNIENKFNDTENVNPLEDSEPYKRPKQNDLT